MVRLLLVLLFGTVSMSICGEQKNDDNDLPPEAIRPCARCVEAREYNLKHPNPYFYYEEYVEAKEKEDASPK